MGRLSASSRAVVATVSALAVAAGAAAIVLAPWPTLVRDPQSLQAAPPASASVSVCGGPLLALGRSVGDAAGLTDVAAQSVTDAASSGTPASVQLAAPDVRDGAGPEALSADPVDGERTDLAGAGSAQLDTPDLRGFAASACTRPAMESWIVGGSATTGAADTIVLANPGLVGALVTLTVYGAGGPVTPPAGESVLVAAGSQRVIPLAALALGQEIPVVRVTAAEAPVRASLQASITRVLLPGGIDQVGAAAIPAEAQVIPGIQIAEAPGQEGAADVPALLRMLAPGADATATVTVVGAAGTVGDPQTVQLSAGVPLELDLAGLPVGSYSVRVEASAALTAAVWSTTGFGEGADFAWYAAADELITPSLFATAPGPSPSLTLASDAGEDQVVQLIAGGGDGGATEVTVPAGGSATVDLTAGESYRLVPGEGGVFAAVSYAGAGALAGYTVPAGDAAAASVTVFPR